MSSRLIIAAVQANPTVGAIEKNEALVRERLAQARAAGADIALFSELFLNGYPPEDLALKPAFWRDGQAAIERLALETRDGPAALIGVIWPAKDAASRPRNALAFLAEGEVKG
ncbi:MAG: nitrilase-related carbon-nitrogen hydrolase, partial [Phenylobacterium sp.]|nr:nitrilase-related carbon-nitrogen hydrolase [Phenylobacterium sp.]